MSFAQALAKLLPEDEFVVPDALKLSDRRRQVPGLAAELLFPDNCTYPPNNMKQVLKFITKVEDMVKTGDMTKSAQTRALYYLFLDCGDQFAEHYASEVRMNSAQQHLVRGLRALDRNLINDETVADIGEPWEAELAPELTSRIHRYIVSALGRHSQYVIAYVDGKGLAYDCIGPYSHALIRAQMFFRALQLQRETGDKSILRLMSLAAAEDKQAARLLTELPFTNDEWQLVAENLEPSIQKSPGGLAAQLSVVRALHLGDLTTINRLKPLDARYGLLSKGIGDI